MTKWFDLDKLETELQNEIDGMARLARKEAMTPMTRRFKFSLLANRLETIDGMIAFLSADAENTAADEKERGDV